MSNILLAGGAGFIGSHLADRFIDSGHKVFCADKFIMGDGNIERLRLNPNFVLIHAELADESQVQKIFELGAVDGGIDAVYHLAANSDIQKGGKEPGIDFNDTLLTTRALLEGMRTHNVKNLFFASTSAVYGEKDEALNETTGDLRPVSYYGGCKLASEALISSYVSMCDMNAVVFRFPNVIGPRLTHGVIYDFIRKLQKDNTQLEILGNGKQCKPYIYVLDLVEAIVKLTDSFYNCENPKDKKDNPLAHEEIYNLSIEGLGTTVTRIAEIVVEEMGLSNVAFNYTGGDRGWKGDVPKFEYDISKALSTGWKPKYSSEEAVRQSVRDAINSAAKRT